MFDDIFTEMNTDRGNHRNEGTTRRRQVLEESVQRLQKNKQGIILGARRLAALNKKVGEEATVITPNGKRELEILSLITVHDETDREKAGA